VWQRSNKLGASPKAGRHGLRVLADGGLAMVATSNLATTTTASIMRTDPWGHADCVASGKCTTTKATGCDDADPCTTDFCAADKGCAHGKAGCDDGDACTADTCVKGKGCDHKAKDCSDGDNCTVDTCDRQSGKCSSAKPKCGTGSMCITGQVVCGGKPSCDGGIEVGGSCYTVTGKRGQIWGDAAAECAKTGRALPSITTAAENAAVLTLLKQCAASYVHIGLRYEGGWKWADGTTAGYTNWNENPIKNREYAGVMNSQGKWRIVPTTYALTKICTVCQGYAGVCKMTPKPARTLCGPTLHECRDNICKKCQYGKCKGP